ncbi:MAG: helicase HerA domain-containing protein [Nitrososphaerales archaeon]
MREIGIVVGESKPHEIMFESKRPVSAGEYVIINGNNGKILGLVERSTIVSDALSKHVRNYTEALESKEIADVNTRDKSYRAWVRILGYLDELKNGKAIIPDVPPLPGTDILEAGQDDLGIIFGPENDGWIRIGSLLRNSKVEARVNIDRVVARHLAVLAMTGMGKSNLVSLLAKEMAKIGGTMIIFDYHDDYSSLQIKDINIMDAKINPRLLNFEKFAEVMEIRESATNQMHVLRKAFTEQVKMRQGDDFWESLLANVQEYAKEKSYTESAERVEDKIDDARRRFKSILDPSVSDPTTLIKNGKVNVLSLIELTDRQADIAVRFYLEELLDDRKRATRAKKGEIEGKAPIRFPAPVLVVIEEAHVFIPKDEKTDTKYLAAKVAREGRKFGLGLAIVSQRPRSIDANVLSQMGSLAVMKMVQQDDQAQVSVASEAFSKEIVEQLPSLNPGDAILVGQWVNLPAFVHIDQVMEKKVGADQQAVMEWRQINKMKQATKESTQAMIKKGYLQD